MILTRQSKIKDVWRHPIGHDLLLLLLQKLGRSEKWAESPLVARLPITTLDRMGGAGFTDMLLTLAATETGADFQPEKESKAWWKEAVMYQIFLPSFMDSDHDGVGDLGGVMHRLSYLSSLGVNTLWLAPLRDVECSKGARDFRAPSAEFGSVGEFEELVQAAHARDMRVVMGLDIAFTAQQHPWFVAALENESDRDFYVFANGTPDVPPNNWEKMDGGAAWKWFSDADAWGLSLAGRGCMDLNWSNPALRTEMGDVLRFWMEKGVDGFSLGAVNQMGKDGFADGCAAGAEILGVCGYEQYAFSPALHSRLRELRAGLGVGKTPLLMGEVQGVGTETAKLLTGEGRGELDMLMDTGRLTQKNGRRRGEEQQVELVEIKKHYLAWMERYGAQRWMPLFFENAEMPRMISRIGASPVYRGILAKLLGMLLLTLRGTPVIYQGQELGLTNTRFNTIEELRDENSLRLYGKMCKKRGEGEALAYTLATTPDHARTPIPWSAEPRGGFTGAQPWIRPADGAEYLNVAAQMQDAGSVWTQYQRLIALRKSHPALVYGRFNPVFEKNKKVFCFFRIAEGEKFYVEINITEKECPRPGRILHTQTLLLSNYDLPARSLRPYEANLYSCE